MPYNIGSEGEKMSDIITDPKMISALQELGRGLKSQADLAKLSRELLKIPLKPR